ncbi:hypothetical protein OSTOST_02453 [Ostertagia ostertagi]
MDVLIKAVYDLAVGFGITSSCWPQLQAESPILEVQSSDIEATPNRDLRGELHSARDAVEKSYAVIYAKVNALVKQGNENAFETLSSIAERIRTLADKIGVPIRRAALLSKPDMKKRSLSIGRVDPEETLFCSLCFEKHPNVLPEHMDPDGTRRKGNGMDVMHPLPCVGPRGVWTRRTT